MYLQIQKQNTDSNLVAMAYGMLSAFITVSKNATQDTYEFSIPTHHEAISLDETKFCMYASEESLLKEWENEDDERWERLLTK